MKSIIKTVLIASISIGVILGILYFIYTQIDFIGHKDPKTVAENVKRWNNTLLSAEYRNGTDYFNIDLLDSINIEINTGNNSSGVILDKEYKLSGDTIIIVGGIEEAAKYIDSDKLLIRKNKLLYKIKSPGNFDTIQTMTIKFNKIKR
ncbi:hypothetical protein [Chryseobacterium vrystaatense]|uniref:Uncharacterized protein n=1 Tax=Chryseobacterium vrystaatense TaxID=307480 RepID=A0ABR4UFJ2_9FLAO|nr:hypothetical protein [Chryseobacterium vrystaatense]KFF22667.1 hypothetical protein IW16_26685 [Chryseobacterium vrystaatense]